MNPQKTPGARITKQSSQNSVIMGITIKQIEMPKTEKTIMISGLMTLNSRVEIDAPKKVAIDL